MIETTKLQNIKKELYQIYQHGTRVSNKELKATIHRLYSKYNYHKNAKGTDILKFGFTTKKCKIPQNGKRIDGIELQ